MVRDSSLREIIGAYLFRPVACPDLAAPQVRLFIVASLHLQIIEPGAQERPGLRLVLELGFLRLAVNDDPRRIVGQPDSGVCRIDALAAVSGSTHDVYADILVRNIDLDVVADLRDHRHCAGRGMDPAAGLGHRDALHPVHAALIFQSGIGSFSGNNEAHRFHAADPDLFKADRLDTPAPSLRVMDIHPVNITREQSGLIAASPRADLHDDIFVIIGVLGQEQDPQFFLEDRDLVSGLRQLFLGQCPKFLVILLSQEELGVFLIRLGFFIGLVSLHQRSQIALLLHERHEPLLVRSHAGTHQFL